MTAHTPKPVVGISSCLLGNNVRYDGTNKHNEHILNSLSHHVELIAICPETGIGLGIPRPPIQLVSYSTEIRGQGVKDKNIDVTEDLVNYSKTILHEHRNLSGFIFKSRSPSCGVHDTPIHTVSGETIKTGAGLFAFTLLQLNPTLPVADEMGLQDEKILKRFLVRVIRYVSTE